MPEIKSTDNKQNATKDYRSNACEYLTSELRITRAFLFLSFFLILFPKTPTEQMHANTLQRISQGSHLHNLDSMCNTTTHTHTYKGRHTNKQTEFVRTCCWHNLLINATPAAEPNH